MTEACRDCIYWNQVLPVRGECRRNAPSTYNRKDTRDDSYAAWPMTDHDAWCGEFKSKAGKVK